MKYDTQKYNYVLILKSGDAYFANSLWGLFTEIFTHRLHHWKRGDGWKD